MKFSGHEAWGEPIPIGTPLSRSETLPETEVPQSWVPYDATSWMARSPKIAESGLMES